MKITDIVTLCVLALNLYFMVTLPDRIADGVASVLNEADICAR